MEGIVFGVRIGGGGGLVRTDGYEYKIIGGFIPLHAATTKLYICRLALLPLIPHGLWIPGIGIAAAVGQTTKTQAGVSGDVRCWRWHWRLRVQGAALCKNLCRTVQGPDGHDRHSHSPIGTCGVTHPARQVCDMYASQAGGQMLGCTGTTAWARTVAASPAGRGHVGWMDGGPSAAATRLGGQQSRLAEVWVRPYT